MLSYLDKGRVCILLSRYSVDGEGPTRMIGYVESDRGTLFPFFFVMKGWREVLYIYYYM